MKAPHRYPEQGCGVRVAKLKKRTPPPAAPAAGSRKIVCEDPRNKRCKPSNGLNVRTDQNAGLAMIDAFNNAGCGRRFDAPLQQRGDFVVATDQGKMAVARATKPSGRVGAHPCRSRLMSATPLLNAMPITEDRSAGNRSAGISRGFLPEARRRLGSGRNRNEIGKVGAAG
jgi:hypothetical protein